MITETSDALVCACGKRVSLRYVEPQSQSRYLAWWKARHEHCTQLQPFECVECGREFEGEVTWRAHRCSALVEPRPQPLRRISWD